MAKVIVDFGVASLVIGDLTWGACLTKSGNTVVSTTGSTLTAFDTTGKYWLENPNVTENTLFYIYLTATPATLRLGEFICADVISICNNAILSLGGNVIASLDDVQAEAVLCKALWQPSLDMVLRLHLWNCAIKRATLAPDVATPTYEFAAQFSMPSDLLRLLEVYELNEGYKIERRTIICDESAISIKYVFRNEAINEWDSLLIQAMTAYMGFKLAYPVTKSNSTQEAQWKIFTELLRTAKNIDAQEEPQDQIGDFPFVNVRY